MENKPDFMISYDEFMAKYAQNTEDAISVGGEIAKQAQFFCNHNQRKAILELVFNKKYSEVINAVDEQTSKPISAAKAEVLVNATDEYSNYLIEKTAIENIEQIINSLKALQKGLLVEYGASSL